MILISVLAGCNLSALFFAIFINELGRILNRTGLGIDLQTINIAALIFADDLVLIAKNKKSLKKLMLMTRKYFKSNKLEISSSKSKIMTVDGSPTVLFPESDDLPPIELDTVCSFKYLGIPINNTPRAMFKDFNEHVKNKAKRYLTSVFSLTRSGPDRSKLTYTLWTSCAIPAILYGVEVMPLTESTISMLEKCNNSVGKFILQLPQSSSNVAVHLDAGLRPIWSIIAEKVISYARSVATKPSSYWAKMAFTYNLSQGNQSAYLRYLAKNMDKAKTSMQPPNQLKKGVTSAAFSSVMEMQKYTASSTFAMRPMTKKEEWFKIKP